MKKEKKEDIEIKKTKKRIYILFILGIIVVLIPILLVIYINAFFNYSSNLKIINCREEVYYEWKRENQK